jgi:hypothetical protein
MMLLAPYAYFGMWKERTAMAKKNTRVLLRNEKKKEKKKTTTRAAVLHFPPDLKFVLSLIPPIRSFPFYFRPECRP